MSYKQQLTKSKTGFTIIEVVLVLAIAGLIFLMVFVALPALQRSQRDTQRRQDISRIATALTQYQANNNGNSPTTDTAFNTFKTNYLPAAEFKDPDGAAYNVIKVANTSTTKAPSAAHEVWYVVNAKCNGEVFANGSGNNDYAILYKLEGAGVYCVDNK